MSYGVLNFRDGDVLLTCSTRAELRTAGEGSTLGRWSGKLDGSRSTPGMRSGNFHGHVGDELTLPLAVEEGAELDEREEVLDGRT